MPRVSRTVTLGMMGHSGSRIPAGGGGAAVLQGCRLPAPLPGGKVLGTL